MVEEMCLGAYTEEMLMDNATRSIIPQLIRNNTTKDRIIILYGPWMDGVHDILLDALTSNGILCLRSTEQFILPENIRWIFKMHSVDSVPLHRRAQFRTIQLDQDHVTWKCLAQSWMTTLPTGLQFLENLLDFLVPPLLNYNSGVDSKFTRSTGYHPIKAVRQMLMLTKMLLDGWMEILNKKQTTIDYECRAGLQSTMVIDSLFLSGIFYLVISPIQKLI